MNFNDMFQFYKTRRDTLLGVNPERQITSSLSDCDINEFDELLKEDSELRQLMYTPVYELPEQYKYLLTESLPKIMDYALYDLIKISMAASNIRAYFSKAGDKIVGWCAYHVSEDSETDVQVVDEIKMFSFDLTRPNPVLLRDLQNLVDGLLEKFSKVSWTANPDNPANKIYEQALEKYKELGFSVNKKVKERLITYTIKSNDVSKNN